MTGAIAWNYGQIESLSGQWHSAIVELQQELEAEKTQIAKIADMWTGEAGDAFRAEQKAWQQKADALFAAAEKLSQLISAAGEGMANTEKELQRQLPQ